MGSSKIQFTPGTLSASASGLWSIQFDAVGNAYRVDDAGNSYAMNGMTIHNMLSDRSVSDCHPQSAITDLTTDLNEKENSLGNPAENGQYLVSTTAGVRSWVSPSYSRCIDCINSTMQSFGSFGVSELIIEWDTEVLKHDSAYTHSTVTNPENIEIEFTGWIGLSYHINFETDENNRILTRVWAEKNGSLIPGTITYGYMRAVGYVDVTTNSLPNKAIAVTANDIITVHAEYAYNDDVDQVGDSNDDVYTRAGESHIFITELIKPEG